VNIFGPVVQQQHTQNVHKLMKHLGIIVLIISEDADAKLVMIFSSGDKNRYSWAISKNTRICKSEDDVFL
jgi:ribosomal protein L4